MNGYFIALIIYILLSIYFGGLIAFNVVMYFVKRSNMASKNKSDFYHNTTQPMKIHVFTFFERIQSIGQCREYYQNIREE